MKNLHYLYLLVILTLLLGTSIENVSAWILNVEIKNEGLVDDEIQITVKVESELIHDMLYNFEIIKSDSDSGLVSINIPEIKIPSGERYEVCAEFLLSSYYVPNCKYFVHEYGDERIIIPA